MSEPRKTPRTDAEEQWAEWNDNEFKCVPVARELERELAAAQEAALHAQEHCLTAQARGFDLQAQLDAARNALSETLSKWVPVGERLPEAKDEYLCRFVGATYGPYMSVQAFDGADFLDYGEPAKGITHWMPLPEAPK